MTPKQYEVAKRRLERKLDTLLKKIAARRDVTITSIAEKMINYYVLGVKKAMTFIPKEITRILQTTPSAYELIKDEKSGLKQKVDDINDESAAMVISIASTAIVNILIQTNDALFNTIKRNPMERAVVIRMIMDNFMDQVQEECNAYGLDFDALCSFNTDPEEVKTDTMNEVLREMEEKGLIPGQKKK